MRRVTYKSVLNRIAAYLGEADGLSVEDKALAEMKINLAFRLGYEHFFHPDITLIEERTLRQSYDDAEPVTATEERFFPDDGQYYQALVDQSPATEAPAIAAGGGQWQENSAYWAKCQASYSGDDHADATDYAVGHIVRNPANRRFYQCHTAHTSASATLDATKFGLLTPFVRSLEYEQTGETAIGQIKQIWDSDPRYNNHAGPVARPAFRLRQDYAQVLGTANILFVEFRAPCPVFSGLTRDDASFYSAGDQVYDAATGDYWIAQAAINIGESPTGFPAKWARVVFPWYLAEFVAQTVYAMLTNAEQETPENFTVQMTAGYPLLQAEIDSIERQQGQTRQLNVMN